MRQERAAPPVTSSITITLVIQPALWPMGPFYTGFSCIQVSMRASTTIMSSSERDCAISATSSSRERIRPQVSTASADICGPWGRLLLLLRGRISRTEFCHTLRLAGTELATSSRLFARLIKPDSNVFVAMWAIHNKSVMSRVVRPRLSCSGVRRFSCMLPLPGNIVEGDLILEPCSEY